MTKKNGSNSGAPSKKGGSIKGPDCAVASATRREAIRKEEDRLAKEREALKATGEFFLRQNDGRETDIFQIEAGEIGQYAIPGGDKPSVHLHVAEVGTPEKPLRVVYFDNAHEGSGLPGYLSKETFLPVWALSKDSFTSRMDGHRAETQNELFSFLTKAIDDTRVQVAKDKDANELTAILSKADKDLRGIKRSQIGLYAVTRGDDVAIFKVFIAKQVSVSVLRSTIPDLPASKAFLPAYLLEKDELKQMATISDAVYAGQLAIYNFLKPILDVLVDDEPQKVSRPPVVLASVKKVDLNPVTSVTGGKVATMASVKSVMKGAVGVTTFTVGEQSLTVEVHDKTTPKGPVRFFEVTKKSGFAESTVLSVEVGTYVTAEQLIAETISKADMAGMPPKSSGAKLALITFIWKAVKGVRFCRKPSEAILPKVTGLKLVA